MFSWMRTRPNKPSPRMASRGALRCERLEERVCLDFGSGEGGQSQVPPGDNPPVLTANDVEYIQGRTVRLSGNVVDEFPDSVVVVIDGVVMSSATANTSGNFTTDDEASSLGNLTIQAVDIYGQWSNTVLITLERNPPEVVELFFEEGAFNWYTFYTTVTGPATEELEMVFTGVVESLNAVMINVDEYGLGFVDVQLQDPPNDSGTALGTVTDAWGQSADMFVAVERH